MTTTEALAQLTTAQTEQRAARAERAATLHLHVNDPARIAGHARLARANRATMAARHAVRRAGA